MLNHITVQGRLTADPQLKKTQNGLSVVSFSVACERDFASANGQKETDFIDVTAWRQTAEFVSKYFNKGSQIVVDGRLQIRLWNDKDGNKRRTAEVLADHVYFSGSASSSAAKKEEYPVVDVPDDLLPF